MQPISSDLEQLISVMRGCRVMIDSDLARLYGVSTKRLNEQVKRNLKRFPEDFMFQLSANPSQQYHWGSHFLGLKESTLWLNKPSTLNDQPRRSTMHTKDLEIFDELPVNFFIKDEDGKYLWANKAAYTMAKCGSRGEMIGKTDLDMIWAKAEGTEAFIKNDHEVLETGKTFKGEEHAKLSSGETLSAQAIKFVSELDGKKCMVGIAIMRD